MNSRGGRCGALRRAALATTALVGTPVLALAQDATWAGPGTDFAAPSNWSTGAVPTGAATFGAQGPTTPTIGAGTSRSLGTLNFAAGAQAYVLNLSGAQATLTLSQGGIANASGITQTILLADQTTLRLQGTGTIGGNVTIRGTGSPATASLALTGSATAGLARIENATLSLVDSASADSATLVGGRIVANGTSTLANATLELTGTSSVGGQATLGASRITVLSGGVLRAISGATGGTAAITLQGTGNLDIQFVSGPTFTIGSLAGDGRVTLGERTLLLDGPGGTFAGVFEGGSRSGVTFASGTTTLSGTSAMTGNFLVRQGATLLVDGNTQSVGATFVDAGGTLGGTGTVGRVLLDGTLSPGNAATPVSTLTVTGSLAIGPGATTALDVTPTGADRVNVSSVASLGGTLQIVAPTATLPIPGQRYTIVQAARVDGTFASVTDNLAFYAFTPTYSGTAVTLGVSQLSFNTPDATGGARNLSQQATGLDRYDGAARGTNPDFDRVLDQLLRLSPAAATTALHSVSGESYAAFTSVGLEQLDRFRMAALDAAGACEGRGGQMRGRYCAWADLYYVNASLDGSGDLAGFDYTLSGFQGGVEARVAPDAVVGATIGYGNQRMRGFDFASRRLDGDALFAGVYGTYGVGPWQAVGLLGYSRFDVDAERDIAVGNIARQARGNFSADGVTAAAALRYRTEIGGIRVVPEALLAFAQYWQGGLTETGADSLNLRVGGTNANSLTTGIGVTASTDIALSGGAVLRPFATLRYEHDWLAGAKEDHRITASFASVPEAGAWTVFGQNRGRENVIGRLGLVGEMTQNVALFGTVGGQLNSNGSEWGLGGGVRVTF